MRIPEVLNKSSVEYFCVVFAISACQYKIIGVRRNALGCSKSKTSNVKPGP